VKEAIIAAVEEGEGVKLAQLIVLWLGYFQRYLDTALATMPRPVRQTEGNPRHVHLLTNSLDSRNSFMLDIDIRDKSIEKISGQMFRPKTLSSKRSAIQYANHL
jgi:hypothetical protein